MFILAKRRKQRNTLSTLVAKRFDQTYITFSLLVLCVSKKKNNFTIFANVEGAKLLGRRADSLGGALSYCSRNERKEEG
jgi:hypothetical protein